VTTLFAAFTTLHIQHYTLARLLLFIIDKHE